MFESNVVRRKMIYEGGRRKIGDIGITSGGPFGKES